MKTLQLDIELPTASDESPAQQESQNKVKRKKYKKKRKKKRKEEPASGKQAAGEAASGPEQQAPAASQQRSKRPKNPPLVPLKKKSNNNGNNNNNGNSNGKNNGHGNGNGSAANGSASSNQRNFVPVTQSTLASVEGQLDRFGRESRLVAVVLHPMFSEHSVTMNSIRAFLQPTFGQLVGSQVFVLSEPANQPICASLDEALAVPRQLLGRALLVLARDMVRAKISRSIHSRDLLAGFLSMATLKAQLAKGKLLVHTHTYPDSPNSAAKSA